ncbi:MAG: alpha/beta fold hydrolase [Acidimicrobiia bacterium]
MAPKPRDAALVVGGVVSAVAGAVGLAWTSQRAFVAAARRRPDPESAIEFVFDEMWDLTTFDGGSLRVYARGDGAPILFSHGVTLSSRTWARQFETLAEQGFRVIAFDHRGHGASLPGEHGHGVSYLERDVATVVEALDLTNAVLVGHSMGGLAVQGFALGHPTVLQQRVQGLVLLSTMSRARNVGPSVMREALTAGVRNGPALGSMMAMPNFGYMLARIGFGRDAHHTQVDFVREMIAECPAETSHEATTALLDTDFSDELPHINVPVLVIVGSADVITPPPDARRLARLIPGARLSVMSGAGHMVMLERSDEFNALVAEFARSVQTASTGGSIGDARRKDAR